MTMPQDLTVGEAVLYPHEQAVGLIYAMYERGAHERPGVQLLLSDGRDLSGFSAEEADQFLQAVDHTELEYKFHHVGQLRADYQRGVFEQAFATARLLAGFREIKYLQS